MFIFLIYKKGGKFDEKIKLLIIALLILSLTACTSKEANEKNMKISVDTNVKDELFMISYEYFINSKAIAGSSISKADSKALDKNVKFNIEEKNIPEAKDIQLKFYLSKDPEEAKSKDIRLNEEKSTNLSENIPIYFDKETKLIITENSDGKYILEVKK